MMLWKKSKKCFAVLLIFGMLLFTQAAVVIAYDSGMAPNGGHPPPPPPPNGEQPPQPPPGWDPDDPDMPFPPNGEFPDGEFPDMPFPPDGELPHMFPPGFDPFDPEFPGGAPGVPGFDPDPNSMMPGAPPGLPYYVEYTQWEVKDGERVEVHYAGWSSCPDKLCEPSWMNNPDEFIAPPWWEAPADWDPGTSLPPGTAPWEQIEMDMPMDFPPMPPMSQPFAPPGGFELPPFAFGDEGMMPPDFPTEGPPMPPPFTIPGFPGGMPGDDFSAGDIPFEIPPFLEDLTGEGQGGYLLIEPPSFVPRPPALDNIPDDDPPAAFCIFDLFF